MDQNDSKKNESYNNENQEEHYIDGKIKLDDTSNDSSMICESLSANSLSKNSDWKGRYQSLHPNSHDMDLWSR